LHGVLEGAAVSGRSVVVRVAPGRAYRGKVAGVGGGVVQLDAGGSNIVLVVVNAITSVRGEPGAALALAASSGTHQGGDVRELAALLADVEPERPDLVITLRHDVEALSGTLLSVGADMVVVRVGASATGSEVAVPLQSISAVALTASAWAGSG
jgi:hypothetical protein